MKKVPNLTSRVLWQMGQALLPEHFFAQEESLREELALRMQLQQPLSWGIGSLEWDGFEIPKGVVSISELRLVLASGTLIDIPGNTAPAMLNLKAAGNHANVYVHLQSGFDRIHVGGRGELAEESIERILQKVVLSTNPTSDTGAQSFKLAEFDCRPDGVWVLNPSFIPPLLLIGTSPFFESIRLRMDSMLRSLRQALLSEVQENYLAAASNAAGRIALRGLFSLQALLVDLKSGVRIHPYELFSALRSLYIDVCVHRDVLPGEIEKPYRHDDIAGSFEVILERLDEQAQTSRRSIPYTEFTRADGLLRCELGKDIRRAKDVFLLVQKPQVTGKIDLARVKLASESRIDLVYERSLRGIPFQSLENPPFQHGLANTVDFYSITPGQEWDYAVREGAVVFFDAPVLTGCRFYLYWRSE